MKVLFLGDIHGDWSVLNNPLQKTEKPNLPIIQVGDMGLGFGTYTYLNQKTGLWELHEGNKDPKSFPKRFRFIRGNHDNPKVCRKYPNYMGDYGIDKLTGAFFLSGAWSIDRENRIIGVDWWEDEELSQLKLQKAIDLYSKTKPKVVISHTCPATIGKMLSNPNFGYHADRTEKALDMMWNNHRPELWIFGHWHRPWNKNILGTQFICLNINEERIINI